MRVGIVADDLTGAADTASQFVRVGWQTELQLRPGQSGAQVLAVTTDSRNLSAADAAKAVSLAVRALRDAGITHLYKKIDSTLRGQIQADVRAALDAWSADAIAVVCPAFPTMGRTLVDGNLLVNGVPVAETALGVDPITPVTESHLPTLLDAAHVAQDAGESAQHLADRIVSSGRLVVVDAVEESDLRRLAEAVALLGPRSVPAGSAGLARHLARAWPFEKPISLGSSSESSVVRHVNNAIASSITIVIMTSLQDMARRQAAAVAAAGARHAQPTPADLIDDDAWERWSAAVIAQLDRDPEMLLLTAPLDRRKYLPPALIPDRFADLAARLIKKDPARVSGVVVTGGDGARALAHALDVSGFQIQGEVVTGVPFGTLIGGAADGLRFVTKAGGFGDADTLVEAVKIMDATKVAPYTT